MHVIFNVKKCFHFLFLKYLDFVSFSRDETPTAEQTQAFVNVCETFIRRNPLHAIGKLSSRLYFCLQLNKYDGLDHRSLNHSIPVHVPSCTELDLVYIDDVL